MEERREPLAGRKIHAIAAAHLVVAADGEIRHFSREEHGRLIISRSPLGSPLNFNKWYFGSPKSACYLELLEFHTC